MFGNLPDARPGTRSPRRDSARAGREQAAAGAAAAEARPPSAGEARAPPPPEAPGGGAPEPAAAAGAAPQRQGGGLEDIAWAGVAAAAEAATIGVRLASRAIEALRGNPEKE